MSILILIEYRVSFTNVNTYTNDIVEALQSYSYWC